MDHPGFSALITIVLRWWSRRPTRRSWKVVACSTSLVPRTQAVFLPKWIHSICSQVCKCYTLWKRLLRENAPGHFMIRFTRILFLLLSQSQLVGELVFCPVGQVILTRHSLLDRPWSSSNRYLGGISKLRSFTKTLLLFGGKLAHFAPLSLRMPVGEGGCGTSQNQF